MSNATANSFSATRKMFSECIGYKKSMSYDDWVNLPEDYKAAALFVHFYDQITLAWFSIVKVYGSFADQDGVDIVLQYLMKNVEIINNDPKRFTPAYLYTISYNCINSMCNGSSRLKKIADNECVASCILGYGENDADIFDTVSGDLDCNDAERDRQRKAFWDLIESKGKETIVVVAELLGDKLDWTSYTGNPSEKIHKFSKWDFKRISEERKAEIIADLRKSMSQLDLYAIM